ncbi:MAG TPA: hypothetical protein VHL54_02550 [Actinomycetota bacterium]|nr:hypothetical protein [Actinomycetota bacterium]
MPARRNQQELFIRWLWLVYLPLALLIIGLPLVFLQVLTGWPVWVVGFLSVYCVIPVRLLLETRRKGLELPRPPGKGSPRPAAPAKEPKAAGRPAEERSTARVERPPVPARIRRRRALAGVLGIGVLSLIGGLLFIIGMGRASSGQLGLILIGVGGFLMLLSVTLPTFKMVDITLRAVGRLLSKKGSPRSRAAE